MNITYDERGLVPVVVQDSGSNEVLMFAYANKEALERTIETGNAWYWSRSRNKLWQKGEQSGNTQVVDILTDCDRDAVIYKVQQKGVACHLNTYSCFENALTGLFRTINERKLKKSAGSYTAKLFADPEKITRKLNEEVYEVIQAGNSGNKEAVVQEVCDLLYFLLVFLAQQEISLSALWNELRRRRR